MGQVSWWFVSVLVAGNPPVDPAVPKIPMSIPVRVWEFPVQNADDIDPPLHDRPPGPALGSQTERPTGTTGDYERFRHVGIVDGKRLLITGVLTDASLAFSVARLAQEEGAEVVLTGAGRGLRLTERTARKLPNPVEVLEFDVTSREQTDALRQQLTETWGRVDGALHAIGFAPEVCLGEDFMAAEWSDVAVAMEISAYSLKTVAEVVAPLMTDGGSIVGLDFDARFAWPAYNWMGVAKAALESTSRYLARSLGKDDIRVNIVAAGPIRTMAAKSIPGFAAFEDAWGTRAPLGWDINDSEPVARACVALMSDWFPATTGEMVHVDGGYHAIGA